MKLPPKWLRRLLIDPAVVVGFLLAVIALPFWVLAALIVSRFVPGNWRILRVAWFLFLYLAVEVAALVTLFVLWIASGFGWRIRSAWFQQAHFVVLGVMLRLVVGSARRAFKLEVALEEPPSQTVGQPDRKPALILSRHAGPGDSILLMDYLVNGYKRRPRIVLKEFLQWDPAVDVMLNRLPTAFVPVGRKGGEALIESIRHLAGGMERDDAFVIFPEGANYTERRRARAIRKLREIGRPDLAERAADLQMTLPPRTTGVQTALDAAQGDADVFFIGHAGLEAFLTPGDIWRAIPIDTTVAARTWPIPAEELPQPD
ncbi:MAG: 1-acyl-sn-glycerol-3-phosphate acyltransferase, partial [Acidimicrobiia bacterium]|nr:1-acyl-sn-glycerol-3-phosphate acyltransferase [Acidimicrobiia bacterium]